MLNILDCKSFCFLNYNGFCLFPTSGLRNLVLLLLNRCLHQPILTILGEDQESHFFHPHLNGQFWTLDILRYQQIRSYVCPNPLHDLRRIDGRWIIRQCELLASEPWNYSSNWEGARYEYLLNLQRYRSASLFVVRPSCRQCDDHKWLRESEKDKTIIYFLCPVCWSCTYRNVCVFSWSWQIP